MGTEDNIWKTQFKNSERSRKKEKNREHKKSKCRKKRKSRKKEKEGSGFFGSIYKFFEGSDLKKLALGIILMVVISKIVNASRNDYKHEKLESMLKRTKEKLIGIKILYDNGFVNTKLIEVSSSYNRDLMFTQKTGPLSSDEIKKVKESWNHNVSLYNLLKLLLEKKKDSTESEEFSKEYSVINDEKSKPNTVVGIDANSNPEALNDEMNNLRGIMASKGTAIEVVLRFIFKLASESLV